MKRFRAPDTSDGMFYTWAVWYGPGGPAGDCATEVERYDSESFVVREYCHIGGLIDDYNPETPFLCTEIVVKAPDMRSAAALGVLRIAERGGSESFVSELPV